MTMGDQLHYWDFPEGSDQYFWRKEKALYPRWHEDVSRLQQTYWREVLDQLPDGQSLVTNTYAEDMKDWTMPESCHAKACTSVKQVETCASEGCEKKIDEKSRVGDSMAGTKDVQDVTTHLNPYAFIEFYGYGDDDDDDDDDSAFGICMCASF